FDSPLLALIQSDLDRYLHAAPDAAEIRAEVGTGTTPTNSDDRDEFQRAAWMRALTNSPTLSWSSAVAVELGNLEMRAGRPLAAAPWYERALPGLPGAAKFTAAYNLGAARFRAHQYTPARTAFLLAVDCATDAHAAAAAWWWVGRS